MPDASVGQSQPPAAILEVPNTSSNIQNGELFYGGLAMVVAAVATVTGFVIVRRLKKKEWEVPVIAIGTAIGGFVMMVLAVKVVPMPRAASVIWAMPIIGLSAWIGVVMWAWISIQARLEKLPTADSVGASIHGLRESLQGEIGTKRAELVALIEGQRVILGKHGDAISDAAAAGADFQKIAERVAWLKSAVDLIHEESSKMATRWSTSTKEHHERIQRLDERAEKDRGFVEKSLTDLRALIGRLPTDEKVSAALAQVHRGLLGPDQIIEDGVQKRIDGFLRRPSITELNYVLAQIEARLDVLLEPEFLPDWGEWGTHGKYPQVQLWQAVSLSLDFDPKKLVGGYMGLAVIRKLRFSPEPLGIQRTNLFAARLTQAEEAMGSGFASEIEREHKRNATVDLESFSRWAIQKAQWPVPAMFSAFANFML